jgi:hypothetical protein
VLLRVVDEPWPFPPNYLIVPQPLAALDLLDYPDAAPRRLAREVLNALPDIQPTVLARRSARARAMSGPLMRRLHEMQDGRVPRQFFQGDPLRDHV